METPQETKRENLSNYLKTILGISVHTEETLPRTTPKENICTGKINQNH